MRFVIFRARSRERSQRTSGSISEKALLHAVEVEPRIAKQYKCQYCCSCKNWPWIGDGGWGGKKVSLRRFFSADQKIASS